MPSLAEWHGKEWSHLYGGEWNASTALEEFRCQQGDGTLPTTLLLLEEDRLLGSVSLVFEDFPGGPADMNPWLASLYVLPEHRSRGIGTELVHRAWALFAANGFASHYLFTETRQAFFKNHGYEEIQSSALRGFPITLMRSTSNPSASLRGATHEQTPADDPGWRHGH